MRVLKLIAAAALVFYAAWLVSCNVEWVNDTPTVPDGSINIPSNELWYIPMEEDTVRCDAALPMKLTLAREAEHE